MTQAITALPSQSKAIHQTDQSKVTILTGGRASGKSKTLLLKALKEGNMFNSIIYPTYYQAKSAFEDAYNFLSILNFKASRQSMILFSEQLNIKIKFIGTTDPEKVIGLDKNLIMFDNVGETSNDIVKAALLRRYEQTVVIPTQEYNLGLIKYYQDKDDQGIYNIDHAESSWASYLLQDKFTGGKSHNHLSDHIVSRMLNEDVYCVAMGSVRDNVYLRDGIYGR